MNGLKDFSDAAIGLSGNPLGIIALFIVLVYGVAALVAGFSGKLVVGERKPIIWFLALFPCLVLSVFGWLVSQHHDKLYAPKDYKDESHFLKTFVSGSLKKLDVAELPQSSVSAGQTLPNFEEINVVNSSDINSGTDIPKWAKERQKIYKENDNYFLVHVIEPSEREGQLYDIFIYVIEHKNKAVEKISKTEFFFGPFWGNKVFSGNKVDDYIGIRTSAYGPFLAICRITFETGKTVVINRYIDFEMSKIIEQKIR